jgi:sialate O-acetylesterase
LEFGDSLCSKPDFDDVGWNLMTLPCVWESTQVGNFDGVVWFRKKIEIPKSWTTEDLVVELGPIDDMDRTYVNGVMIGKNEKAGLWQIPRIYTIPRDLLNDSIISIAVRVIDNGGGGGIWGNGSKMQIHPKGNRETISLTGNWKFLPVAEYNNKKFYVFDIHTNEYYSRPKTSIDAGSNTPTMLYNAMIAPIIPFSIKGVIWYQGETNSDMPDDYNSYKTLLPLLIKNWRSDWDEGNFPFYYAQIAPFMYGEKSRSQIIREAQLKSLSVPKTGMAVLLDLGIASSIHPSNKQDVGSRLALWALAKDYHKNIPYSGPLYKSMKVQKNKIIVSFDHIGKGLVLLKKTSNSNFMIAGTDRIFVKAEVKVVGNKIIFSNNNVQKPVAVRYGWSNFVDGNLYNTEGLPASSFRTDDWED